MHMKPTLPAGGNLGPRITMFMGGTGGATFARSILERLSWNLSVAVPTSDNGGSTRKIVDLVGGPAIGDFRSILVRMGRANITGYLDPAEHPTLELLHHRLPKDAAEAAGEWQRLIGRKHDMLEDMPSSMADIIHRELRAFDNAMLGSGRPSASSCRVI